MARSGVTSEDQESCATDAPRLAGRWEYFWEEQHPLSKAVACDMYRWHAPTLSGRFFIDYVCPKDESPRRFFPKRWLTEVRKTGQAEEYTATVARAGIPILCRMEEAAAALHAADPAAPVVTAVPRKGYEFYHAIHAQRLAGRYALKRDFRHLCELVNLAERNSDDSSLLLELSRKNDDGKPRNQRPTDLLRELAEAGGGVPPLEVVDRLIRMVQEVYRDNPDHVPLGEDVFPIWMLPGRNAVDAVLVDGIVRAWDRKQVELVWRAVASSLLDGYNPFTVESDLGAAQDFYSGLMKRLIGAFESKPRAAFRGWLTEERKRGFVRISPKERAGKPLRTDEHRDLGTRSFKHLLWLSTQAMSRATGALTAVAFADFCESQLILPDAREQILFAKMHMPQYALAGLPLTFFGRPQLRWVLEPLLEVWAETNPDPTHELAVAKLLGSYGALTGTRRGLDRNRSRLRREKKSVTSETNQASQIESAETPEMEPYVGQIDGLSVFRGTTCDHCRGKLKNDPTTSGAVPGGVVIRVFCTRCEYQEQVIMRTADFEHLVGD